MAMNKTPKNYFQYLFVIILVNLFLFNACTPEDSANSNSNKKGQNSNSAKSQSTTPSDNLEELSNLIRLPEIPEEVVWKEETLGKQDGRAPGPTDRKIIAVFKFKPEDLPKLLTLIEKGKLAEQAEIPAESWFPEELTAQAQLSGNDTLKGTAYGANDFFNIPFGAGRITRIENTNYFILELTTT